MSKWENVDTPSSNTALCRWIHLNSDGFFFFIFVYFFLGPLKSKNAKVNSPPSPDGNLIIKVATAKSTAISSWDAGIMVVSERLDSLFLRVHACQTHKRRKKKNNYEKEKSCLGCRMLSLWGTRCDSPAINSTCEDNSCLVILAVEAVVEKAKGRITRGSVLFEPLVS